MSPRLLFLLSAGRAPCRERDRIDALDRRGPDAGPKAPALRRNQVFREMDKQRLLHVCSEANEPQRPTDTIVLEKRVRRGFRP